MDLPFLVPLVTDGLFVTSIGVGLWPSAGGGVVMVAVVVDFGGVGDGAPSVAGVGVAVGVGVDGAMVGDEVAGAKVDGAGDGVDGADFVGVDVSAVGAGVPLVAPAAAFWAVSWASFSLPFGPAVFREKN